MPKRKLKLFLMDIAVAVRLR